MKLSFLNRVTLLGVLPEQGDFVTLKIVRQLREELAPSEEEIKHLEIKQENNQIFWKAENDQMKDVLIGEKATDIIVDVLKRLNEQKKLTPQHLELYEIFVEK